MSFVLAIETEVPKYKHYQKDILHFYQQVTDNEDDKRKIKIIGEKAGITTRYSVLKDFSLNKDEYTFFPPTKNLEPSPTINTRMQVYKEEALALALKTIGKIKNIDVIKQNITHIITVTCTGLYAPGLDIELIQALNLAPTTARSSVNFMGCNAAILALKQADAICKTQKSATVLIVCVELSTIHFQNNFSDDYLLSNLIFGDGCATLLLSSNQIVESHHPKVEIKNFYSYLVHAGKADMTWNISDKGFILNLTSYVSQLINGNIKTMLDALSINANEIDYWAIHPGGKKILDEFCVAMNLEKDKLNSSYSILNDYGNMSSPTILFVLKEMLESNKTSKKNETIFAAAFGPGLSIETMMLQYV
jgi:alpha-pyrone synthase